ncbi:TetR/AcrR family transcriptional regulator [Pseudonocardia sp.]|uniref:TetR/AcrR family transcriptional regulator n=1 Tax=Pseudonocardia sp. TaxID=60912 RepID=UPI002613DE94|nr:TetR/AcrR family transcriptional regulator [Pseudonocardia sp.]
MPRPKVHDDELRERLLERAGALLSGGGPEALSLRTLAQDCDTSTTAVYSLFGGKPALLAELLDDAVARLSERLAAVEPGPDPVEHLVQLGDAYHAAARDDPHLVLETPPTALTPFTDGVHRAVECGALRTDADPPTVALAVQGLVHGLVTLELRGHARPGPCADALRAALEGWRRTDARSTSDGWDSPTYLSDGGPTRRAR